MVMKAKKNVYHLECFACFKCQHRSTSDSTSLKCGCFKNDKGSQGVIRRRGFRKNIWGRGNAPGASVCAPSPLANRGEWQAPKAGESSSNSSEVTILIRNKKAYIIFFIIMPIRPITNAYSHRIPGVLLPFITMHSMIADFAPVCNTFFASTAKLCCVGRGLRPRDVSQREATRILRCFALTDIPSAEALKLQPCLRCLPLTDIPRP